MTLIALERLRAFAPAAKPEILAAIVAGVPQIEAAGIATPLRVQHFLAQIATETGGLHAVEENLNYSAKGLRATFGPHRISDADCQRFGRIDGGHAANPQAIANVIYGGDFGRDELGNTQQGDGWRYRGGGMLQTTGRTNYRAAGHEDDPDALRKPDTALTSALQFWSAHGLNALADRDDVAAVRKVINGGTNGLIDARKYWEKAKGIFV